MKSLRFAGIFALVLTLALGVAAAQQQAVVATPSSIRAEHAELHHELDAALASGGQTALRAQAVAKVLLPHFRAEEAYAMPPLGLLQALAAGQTISPEQRQKAMTMTRQLQSHYAQMLREHEQIHAALAALEKAARQEHKPAAAAFAQALMLHAQNEEQVLYPAAILVGKYLALRASSRR